MKPVLLSDLIVLAGYGHFLLAVGSLAIPRLMNWKGALAEVQVLIRQMFWTYAAYIFFINLFWGVLSVAAPAALLDGSLLAFLLTLFIALYWLGRLFIQFFYFDRRSAPRGLVHRLGEFFLVALFVFFSVVYFLATWHNFHLLNP